MPELLQEMHRWMKNYIKSFYSPDAEVQQGIALKEKHTGYVTAHARALAEHLNLTDRQIALAEIIGLFHDVGRFRQYSIYKTFNDAVSEDHADLALKVIDELEFFGKLSPQDNDLVRFAIKNHNKRYIEETADPEKLLFAKIIRDADKLDIYRVLAPYAAAEKAGDAPNFIKGIGGEEVSPDFTAAFVAGQQVDYHAIRTHGDRKVVRLLWIYDINFAWTLEKIKEQGYVDYIVSTLPKNPQIAAGIERMRKYMAEKIAEGDAHGRE